MDPKVAAKRAREVRLLPMNIPVRDGCTTPTVMLEFLKKSQSIQSTMSSMERKEEKERKTPNPRNLEIIGRIC